MGIIANLILGAFGIFMVMEFIFMIMGVDKDSRSTTNAPGPGNRPMPKIRNDRL